MTLVWGRGANCTELFETRLQAEAALRTWCWVLPTDWCGTSPSGASSAWCIHSQQARSGASPVQLLVVAAACLVVWEHFKDSASSRLQKTDARKGTPSLPSSYLPSPVPLASQTGGPCCPPVHACPGRASHQDAL